MYRKTCEEFVAALHSSAPVPGGGGASALAGALGSALGGMVMNLTAQNPRYADRAEETAALAEKAEDLEKRFLDLINRDATCFEPLSAAYRLPKGTDEEKAKRLQVMEDALVTACEAPMDILKTSVEALDFLSLCLEKGAKIALSDVGCGASFLRACADGAILNIQINAGMMKTPGRKEAWLKEALGLKQEADEKADRIYAEVSARITQ